MLIFVSEFLCGGAWPEPELTGSLAAEGLAMLVAAVDDLSALPGITVCTTWDVRLGRPPFARADVTSVGCPDDEALQFERLARTADATLVIAPEYNGLLERRTSRVEQLGRRVLGSSSSAVALCGDKLALADHLLEAGIPTPSTHELSWRDFDGGSIPSVPLPFPIVVKPRCGAGSTSTFQIDSFDELSALARRRASEPWLEQAIWQPLAGGTPHSVAVLCSPEGNDCEPLPVARQFLSDDGRFRYLGGGLPVTGSLAGEAQVLAVQACRSVPGLRGYVGVDLLLDTGRQKLTLIEINPRLTTSYLGYRRLLAPAADTPGSSPGYPTGSRLFERILYPDRKSSPLTWREQWMEYAPDSRVPLTAPQPRSGRI